MCDQKSVHEKEDSEQRRKNMTMCKVSLIEKTDEDDLNYHVKSFALKKLFLLLNLLDHAYKSKNDKDDDLHLQDDRLRLVNPKSISNNITRCHHHH